MKRLLFVLLVAMGLVLPSMASAQSREESMIPVAVYVPDVGKYASVQSILETKLNLIATEHGMTGSTYHPQFVMYPTISVLDEQRTTTPPVMTIVQLQVNVYIADYLNDNRFASTSFTVKGGGKSEEKAYMDAVKKINNNADLQRFVSQGKQRILEYYNTMCDKIITEANALSQTKEYDRAMAALGSIPKTASCFDESRDALVSVYGQYYTNNCEHLLQLARASAASRDMEKALMYISDIPSDCSCHAAALELYGEIVSYVKEQERQKRQDVQEQKEFERQKAMADQEWRHKREMLLMGMTLYQYQHEQRVQERREERAYEIARISAMNSINISNGAVIRDYVNSQINPYW